MMRRNSTLRNVSRLMATASAVSLAMPALAGELLYSSTGQTSVETGERVTQVQGLTQVRLENGATVSILDRADYRINADSTVDLYCGSMTVVGGDGPTMVRMPEGALGQVTGPGSSASFSVCVDGADDGEGRGHVLTGSARLGRGDDNLRQFDAGEMFAFTPGTRIAQVVSNGAQATPGSGDVAQAPPVADMAAGGPVAAAVNGLPVTLGDALAAVGASGDVIAAARRVEAGAANPALDTFPSGDLGLLVAGAAGLENAYGGTPFTGAQANIVRTYLGFLAGGGQASDFLSSYAGLLGQYLDLVRSGGAPSSFGLANLPQIDSFITYLDRTGGFASLAARDRVLLEAYLEFIGGGGNADLFAGRFTDLTAAYFAFLRGGGDPLEFAGASQATLDSYIAFLAESGLAEQLGAADRALFEAYLANGGFAFAGQYRAALSAYYDFLAAGRLPSSYTAADQASLQAWLATLEATGLLEGVLGEQAGFFAAYLDYLQGGGSVDGFAGLPANIFAGYSAQLDSYFVFLAAGNLPSAYQGADIEQLQAFVAQLRAAGGLEAFLGSRAAFFADFNLFVAGGGDADAFAQLNANIFAGYAQALAAYYDYLAAGGVPSTYGALSQQTIAAYLAALEAAGASGGFLADLAEFYTGYFAFVSGGGNPDNFAGLPVPPDYPAFASALNAYAAYLARGGLPADYAGVDLVQLQGWIEALASSGQLAALLGDNADLLSAYFAYLAGGGTANGFAGLPIYGQYVTALNDYFAFLVAGGLPGDYTALTAGQIEAYLAALTATGSLASFGALAGFFGDYYAFLVGGGDPATYPGIPVYADYLAALQAYYDYLAAGGTPSAYPALTAAQVIQYLEALDGAGVLKAQLAGEELTFVLDYLAYLQGGGNPDDFAGLPGSGSPALLAAASSSQGTTAGAAAQATFGDDDEITGITFSPPSGDVSLTYGGAGQTLEEHGQIGDTVAWTRYEQGAANGVSNFNTHLLVGTPAIDIPTVGNVEFSLLGGTAPTDSLGGAGEVGYFSGRMAVAFKAVPEIGLDLDVFVGTRGWNVATARGADEPDFSGILLAADGSFSDTGTKLVTTGIEGDACSASCNTSLFGSLFGNGASHAGFNYLIKDDSGGAADRNYINGVAVWGQAGAAVAGLGTMPDTGGGETAAVLVTDRLFSSEARLNSSNDQGTHPLNLSYTAVISGNQLGYEIAASGEVVGFVRPGAFGGSDRIGTASNADSGETASGLIAWTRWTDGVIATVRNAGPAYGVPLSANQGYHIITGTPVTNLPTNGRVEYELVGGTRPTQEYGVAAPGTLVSGAAAVQFGTAPKVGIELEVDFNSATYLATTNGGLADLSASELTLSDGAFYAIGAFGNVTGGSCGTTCRPIWTGFLSGEGGSEMGLEYIFQLGNSNNELIGTAAFVQAASGGETGGGGTGGFTGTRTGIVYYTYVDGSLNSGFGGSATLVDGGLTGFESAIGTVLRSTAQVVEAGDVGELAWARWTNGTVTNDGIFGNLSIPVGANGGYHVIAGNASTTLPASGRIDYALIGTTSATDDQESAPGTMSGALAIQFGTTNRVGYDMQMAVGGKSWGVSSTGGAANPGASEINLILGSAGPTFGGTFNSNSGAVTAGGGACATACNVSVSGALYGANGAYAGVAMNVLDIGANGPTMASGLAMFGPASIPTNPYAAAPDSIHPAQMAVAPAGDWDRWSAPANGFTPVVFNRGPGSAPAIGALTAHDAEAMLRGLVTFSEPQ